MGNRIEDRTAGEFTAVLLFELFSKSEFYYVDW